MKRKFWLVLLAVLSVLCLSLGLAACGGGGEQSGEQKPEEPIALESDYVFVPNEEGYTVTDYTGTAKRAHIPAEHDGKPVTEIGEEAFSTCIELTEIVIPDGVTKIGQHAFEACIGFTEIVIPDSVTEIGERAFMGCYRLATLTLGSGIKTIGQYAFLECNELQSIQVKPENQKFHSAGNCVIETGTKTLFLGCKTSEIPDDGSVTVIGSEAFDFCIFLTDLVIPDSVTKIAERAFIDCLGLMKLTIPESVTEIGYDAFSGCSKLVEIWNYSKLPIEKDSYGLRALQVYTTDEESKQVQTADGYLFYEDEEVSYLLGYVGNETKLTLPETSPKGRNYAIYHDAFLTPEQLSATANEGLTEVVIPDNVTEIGACAFFYCTWLTRVTIGNGVQTIGEQAFYGCVELKQVTIGSSVHQLLGWGTFWGCYKLVEIWNHSELQIEKDSHYLNALQVYAKDEESKQVQTADGYIFYEDDEMSYLLGYVGNETKITLPAKSPKGRNYAIYQYAFYGCKELTEIVIPDGVTEIGRDAFDCCWRLTTITIPDSVKRIGEWAFNGCLELTEIAIGNGVIEIGQGAFSYCETLTKVTIGSSVTSIENDAFRDCDNLQKVHFENPNGWTVNGESILPSGLQNEETAAQYLRDTYMNYTWKRTD